MSLCVALGLDIVSIADDIQLYVLLNKPPDAVVSVLGQCLTIMVKWLKENKLSLNANRTEVTLVRLER